MRAPKLLALALGCAAGLLALPSAAGARAYDVHIYKVTSVNLEHRVVTSVDGTARPDEGTALDGTATWTTQLRGPVRSATSGQAATPPSCGSPLTAP